MTLKRKKSAGAMFDEMVGWAVDEGADFIVGETFYYAGEAFVPWKQYRPAACRRWLPYRR